MQAVILAGGLGSRLSEETGAIPKPMVEIGGLPILIHIMKIYAKHYITDFIICCGYKGYVIKEYFANYCLHRSDVTFNLATGEMSMYSVHGDDWTVTLANTGLHSATGGRLLRVKKFIKEDNFCLTYGDGLGNVDVTKSIQFHKEHQKIATMTAVKQPGRFGSLDLCGSSVRSFVEKPEDSKGRINGGFFVLNKEIFKYLNNDDTAFEDGPLQSLASEGQLMAFSHDGFWAPMDTLRDKNKLEELYLNGVDRAPWESNT